MRMLFSLLFHDIFSFNYEIKRLASIIYGNSCKTACSVQCSRERGDDYNFELKR